MKTTVELPEALLRRAKVVAAERKTTLKQLLIEGLEKALGPRTTPPPKKLTAAERANLEICELGYPVLKKRPRGVSNELVNQLREELGI
jgi:hypothetical protein